MDGLEWKRSKYNTAVRWFLRKMEGWAARRADLLVADSTAIKHHLKQAYGRDAAFISYGACADIRPETGHLTPYGLRPKTYYLAIARFVPENQLETIIQGYLDSRVEAPLLIIGDHGNAFGRHLLRRYGDTAIRFPGAVFQKEVLDSLRHYARLYFHGHSVGGTNPSLLEAMACRVAICAHDNPFNRAVLNEEAFYFQDEKGVRRAIQEIAVSGEVEGWVSGNEEKIRIDYRWEEVARRFEALFYQSLGSGPAKTIKKAV